MGTKINGDRKQIDVSDLLPTERCHKCGEANWNFTPEKGTWSCIRCGNLIYFQFGVLEQQIDKVMTSKARHSEFVYSENEEYIKPKKNEDLKAIRFFYQGKGAPV